MPRAVRRSTRSKTKSPAPNDSPDTDGSDPTKDEDTEASKSPPTRRRTRRTADEDETDGPPKKKQVVTRRRSLRGKASATEEEDDDDTTQLASKPKKRPRKGGRPPSRLRRSTRGRSTEPEESSDDDNHSESNTQPKRRQKQPSNNDESSSETSSNNTKPGSAATKKRDAKIDSSASKEQTDDDDDKVVEANPTETAVDSNDSKDATKPSKPKKTDEPSKSKPLDDKGEQKQNEESNIDKESKTESSPDPIDTQDDTKVASNTEPSAKKDDTAVDESVEKVPAVTQTQEEESDTEHDDEKPPVSTKPQTETAPAQETTDSEPVDATKSTTTITATEIKSDDGPVVDSQQKMTANPPEPKDVTDDGAQSLTEVSDRGTGRAALLKGSHVESKESVDPPPAPAATKPSDGVVRDASIQQESNAVEEAEERAKLSEERAVEKDPAVSVAIPQQGQRDKAPAEAAVTDAPPSTAAAVSKPEAQSPVDASATLKEAVTVVTQPTSKQADSDPLDQQVTHADPTKANKDVKTDVAEPTDESATNPKSTVVAKDPRSTDSESVADDDKFIEDPTKAGKPGQVEGRVAGEQQEENKDVLVIDDTSGGTAGKPPTDEALPKRDNIVPKSVPEQMLHGQEKMRATEAATVPLPKQEITAAGLKEEAGSMEKETLSADKNKPAVADLAVSVDLGTSVEKSKPSAPASVSVGGVAAETSQATTVEEPIKTNVGATDGASLAASNVGPVVLGVSKPTAPATTTANEAVQLPFESNSSEGKSAVDSSTFSSDKSLAKIATVESGVKVNVVAQKDGPPTSETAAHPESVTEDAVDPSTVPKEIAPSIALQGNEHQPNPAEDPMEVDVASPSKLENVVSTTEQVASEEEVSDTDEEEIEEPVLEDPISYPRVNLEKIKSLLFLTGLRVHKNTNFERMFNDYWDTIATRLKATLSEKELLQGQTVLNRFLRTKRLRSLHNKLVLGKCLVAICFSHFLFYLSLKGLLKSSMHSTVPLRDISKTVPQEIKRKISIPPKPRRGLLKLKTRKKRKQESAVPYYRHSFGLLGDSQPTAREISPRRSSSRIPGAMVIDPLVRKLANSKRMKVTENAVWLLVIAMKQFLKTVLGDVVAAKKSLDAGIIPALPSVRPQALLKWQKSHKATGSIGPDETTGSDSATKDSKIVATKWITSCDLHTVLARMPTSTRSLGGCVSRATFEHSLFASHSDCEIVHDGAFDEIRRFLLSRVPIKGLEDTKIDPETEKKTEDEPSPPTAQDIPKKVASDDQNAAARRGLGRGAKNLAAMMQRTTTDVSQGAPSETSKTTQANAASVTKEQTIAPGTTGPSTQQGTTQVGESSSREVPAALPGPSEQAGASALSSVAQRKGMGTGVKNLRALKAKSASGQDLDEPAPTATAVTTSLTAPPIPPQIPFDPASLSTPVDPLTKPAVNAAEAIPQKPASASATAKLSQTTVSVSNSMPLPVNPANQPQGKVGVSENVTDAETTLSPSQALTTDSEGPDPEPATTKNLAAQSAETKSSAKESTAKESSETVVKDDTGPSTPQASSTSIVKAPKSQSEGATTSPAKSTTRTTAEAAARGEKSAESAAPESASKTGSEALNLSGALTNAPVDKVEAPIVTAATKVTSPLVGAEASHTDSGHAKGTPKQGDEPTPTTK